MPRQPEKLSLERIEWECPVAKAEARKYANPVTGAVKRLIKSQQKGVYIHHFLWSSNERCVHTGIYVF